MPLYPVEIQLSLFKCLQVDMESYFKILVIL